MIVQTDVSRFLLFYWFINLVNLLASAIAKGTKSFMLLYFLLSLRRVPNSRGDNLKQRETTSIIQAITPMNLEYE